MKVKKYFLVVSLFMIFLAFVMFVSASFNIGNQSYSIQNHYLDDSYLSGWINISFNQMPANSIFTDSLNNNATLIDILNKNSNYDYNCSSIGCGTSYIASGKALTKTFQINEGSTKLIGFKIKDKIESIESLTMTLQSNAPTSCISQVKLDFGKDEIIEIINNKSSTTYCSTIYAGCFETNASSGGGIDPGKTSGTPTAPITGEVILGDPQDVLLTNTPLCQKMQLPESPKIGIGAWIKEATPGNRQVKMELFDLEGNLIDNCTLSKATMGSVGKRVVCSTEFRVIEPQENYICVHTEGASGEYKTRGFIPENESCGFIGYPPATSTGAYDIFAQSLNFAIVGTLNIENELEDDLTISKVIENYILEKYGSLDCSEECLIPLNIISNKDQTITLNNLKLKYNKVGLGLVEENYFYDFDETSSKIDANFQKLFLDNSFLISNGAGLLDYLLSLENTNIINENITIEELNMSINPSITAAEVPTNFKVNIVPSKNIKRYEWDFGDGTTKTTTESSVDHTYSNIQNYSLIVTAIKNDSSEELTKSFIIEVKSPESIIANKIEELRENIVNLKTQLISFDSYSKQRIEDLLNLSSKEEELTILEDEFEQATTDEEYTEIAKTLFSLDIPSSIISTSLGEITINPKSGDMDVIALSDITGETFDIIKKQEYNDAILKWMQENTIIKASTKKIFFKYGGSTENALNIFELKFELIGTTEHYLIIEDLNNLNLDVDYNENGAYKYILIDSLTNRIKLSTTEDIPISDISFFISPKISELSLIDNPISPKGYNKNILWIILIVLGVSLIVFIGLNITHKRNKIKKLFKAKANLANIRKYVQEEKYKGVPEAQIKQNLTRAGWSAGQINYIIKSHNHKDFRLKSMFNFMAKKDNKINKQRRLR